MSVSAHDQKVTHHYLIHYPDHAPRTGDAHYVDFNHIHHKQRPTARCAQGVRYGTFTYCKDAQGQPLVIDKDGQQSGLELHHSHIEYALLNGVDLALFEHDYPGISDRDHVGAWVESAANLEWRCAWHHRGDAGVHEVSHSDYEGEQYIRDLID